MKIIAISDTHGRHDQIYVPGGDVLVHAGDFCRYGTLDEVAAFNDYLGTLPHRHKIIVAEHQEVATTSPALSIHNDEQKGRINSTLRFNHPVGLNLFDHLACDI